PNHLYPAEELYEHFSPEDPESCELTKDGQIYHHIIQTGKYTTDLRESLARSPHDQSIINALTYFIIHCVPKSIIAVMGGHQLSRTSTQYRKIVWMSKLLTEQGKLMISGGGPGAMEATHVGAWLSGKSERCVLHALKMLSASPEYHD